MITLSIIIALTIGGLTYMHTAEQFGDTPTTEELQRYAGSEQLKNGRFVNRHGVAMSMKASTMTRAIKDMITIPDQTPDDPLPVGFNTSSDYAVPDKGEFAVTWFGHSAVLLEIDGRRLLFDPSLSPRASPVPLFGKRFATETPIDLDRIPPLDAVLISHDHYDHLDHGTITAIADRTQHFFVPLGVGNHLRRWGIADEKITELDWWNESGIEGIDIISTPAQHFSGRSMLDGNRTLWTSYVIRSESATLFFSGDGGYNDHFTLIGERFGPFDFTMMECGQYGEGWREIHSMPEEAVQAHLDLRGDIMMPIHWGGFNLAPHRWKEPSERVRAAAAKHGVRIALPMIGQRFIPARALPDWTPRTIAEPRTSAADTDAASGTNPTADRAAAPADNTSPAAVMTDR